MLKKIYHSVESKFPAVKTLKDLYVKVISPRRYRYLPRTVKESKARKIMEIGVWKGLRALEMIEEAKKNYPAKEVEYYGFDLFELLDEKTKVVEFSTPPPSLKEIKSKLEKTGANIHLYRGYTKDTLPEVIGKLPEMDFIYIDGGHSIETIKNDWEYAQKVMGSKTVVIFDDYWNRDDVGCKTIIENIDKNKFEVKILPIQDKFKKDWGVLKINFVKVIRK